ncbi:hypothetical protein CC80DRAFT_556077 [Byssothecium circinans]|uniref:Uncharacterized protein n=1 Tax=Byssothecium circinans TaxID=147558 RepID=A0A6A5T836_9PLEO|nr:hypothetical protein CC80DRAFT_556077 [Byssothecium circinans]
MQSKFWHLLSSYPFSSVPLIYSTFYRGHSSSERIKTGSTIPYASKTSIEDDDAYEDENEKCNEEELDEQMHDAGMPLLPPCVRTPPATPPKSSLVDLNLETLTYFHHFTTTTSLTLPSAESPQLATHYWQTDVILQALGQRWLMAVCTIPEPAALSQLQSIMTTVRGFGVWSDDNDGQEQTFAQASKILNTRSASNAGNFGGSPSCDNTLSTLLDHLGTLPSRMAEALGNPENTQDVFATLSAIAALVECCVASLASDEAGIAWRAWRRG